MYDYLYWTQPQLIPELDNTVEKEWLVEYVLCEPDFYLDLMDHMHLESGVFTCVATQAQILARVCLWLDWRKEHLLRYGFRVSKEMMTVEAAWIGSADDPQFANYDAVKKIVTVYALEQLDQVNLPTL